CTRLGRLLDDESAPAQQVCFEENLATVARDQAQAISNACHRACNPGRADHRLPRDRIRVWVDGPERQATVLLILEGHDNELTRLLDRCRRRPGLHDRRPGLDRAALEIEVEFS